MQKILFLKGKKGPCMLPIEAELGANILITNLARSKQEVTADIRRSLGTGR